MNPHFFFKGKLSREESASAFLATLIEQRPDFRTFLFSALEMAEPKGSCSVTIEKKDVDIKIYYPNDRIVVLIENKLRPGSLKVRQLVRYYQSELKENPNSKILSILVVPSEGTGTSEAARLRDNDQFRSTDFVGIVSWRGFSQFRDLMQQEDADKEFIDRAFDSIFMIIDSAATEKYPLRDGREIAHEIAQNVLRALKKDFPHIRFGFWRGKDYFNIYSIATDITIYVDLAFHIANKAPYIPTEIQDRQHLTVILRTQFALSAKGKKNAAVRKEWDRICQDGIIEILPSGGHKLEGRWFKHEVSASGDTKLFERQLTDMGRLVITSLRHLL